jgi:anti-anti-sigma regulatory factor
MSKHAESDQNVDVRIGKVVWPKSLEGSRNDEQQRELRKLVRDCGAGLILDCTLVEIGNSEIINLLMRVRSQAKRLNKTMVLINVPETLAELIRLCNLKTILLSESDEAAARKLISDRATNKPSI